MGGLQGCQGLDHDVHIPSSQPEDEVQDHTQPSPCSSPQPTHRSTRHVATGEAGLAGGSGSSRRKRRAPSPQLLERTTCSPHPCQQQQEAGLQDGQQQLGGLQQEAGQQQQEAGQQAGLQLRAGLQQQQQQQQQAGREQRLLSTPLDEAALAASSGASQPHLSNNGTTAASQQATAAGPGVLSQALVHSSSGLVVLDSSGAGPGSEVSVPSSKKAGPGPGSSGAGAARSSGAGAAGSSHGNSFRAARQLREQLQKQQEQLRQEQRLPQQQQQLGPGVVVAGSPLADRRLANTPTAGGGRLQTFLG